MKEEMLSRSFFSRPTLNVAQELLGKILVVGEQKLLITETEAYCGDDPASHGARGKTLRNAPMFGKPGLLYVYLTYGIHHCVNIVTDREGFPAAVLLRGGLFLKPEKKYIDGPGRLCKQLQLNREHNLIDVCEADNFFILNTEYNFSYQETPRIGIKKATEKRWRFFVPKSEWQFLTERN